MNNLIKHIEQRIESIKKLLDYYTNENYQPDSAYLYGTICSELEQLLTYIKEQEETEILSTEEFNKFKDWERETRNKLAPTVTPNESDAVEFYHWVQDNCSSYGNVTNKTYSEFLKEKTK